jgi:hypothetical protein
VVEESDAGAKKNRGDVDADFVDIAMFLSRGGDRVQGIARCPLI